MSLAANIYTVSRRLDRLLLILTDGEVCVLRLHNPSSNVGRENHILHLVRKIVPVPAVLASGGDWSIHSFVHGDFNSTNILVHKGAVTCILDWEFSHAGSPYMDIGNLLRHMGLYASRRDRGGSCCGRTKCATRLATEGRAY
jgi:hypothetical protein